jgi:hypothetical protein
VGLNNRRLEGLGKAGEAGGQQQPGARKLDTGLRSIAIELINNGPDGSLSYVWALILSHS